MDVFINMNGVSKSDHNYVFHDNLRQKQNLRFLWNGLLRCIKNLYIIPLLVVNLLSVVLLFRVYESSSFVGSYTFLWRSATIIVFFVLDMVVLFFFGLPNEYITIMRRIERVPNFRNNDREAPVLLARTILDADSNVERWTFQSYGIGYDEWSDIKTQQQLENALDISVLGVEYGSDNTQTVLKVIYHPGPWPTVIPWDSKYLPKDTAKLCVGLNRSYPVFIDLSVHPHLFVAGETGSGKSVLITSIINQCLLHQHRVILVDMKHFVDYGRLLPHLYQAVDDADGLHTVLENLIEEMHQRLNKLKQAGCPNIVEYNKQNPEEQMERIICGIDEYMEAIVKNGSKEQKCIGEQNEAMVASLCKLSRAAGINMIMGMQRGGQEISGQIRSNCRVLLGSCSDNLSIVMSGSTELGRMIPADSKGMFVSDDRQLFKSFFGGFDI